MNEMPAAKKSQTVPFFDRALGYLAPSLGLRRIRARIAFEQVRAAYEGASRGRATKNWRTSGGDANSVLAGGLPILRARSRDLTRNNPWATKAVDVIESNVVGTGIIPTTKSIDAKLKKTYEDLWIAWGDESVCDADGRMDFYGLQSLVIRAVVESGSCLIRRRWRRASDGLPVPFQLQVLEPDFLDSTKNERTENGNTIIQGIEFDKLGRRKAYWLFDQHPGAGWPLTPGLKSSRIDADDIIHVFRTLRPGQVDGVPFGAPCILRLRDLDEYENAQLIRQKIAACFVAFVHDIESMEEGISKAKKDALEQMEPGLIEVLPPGKDVTFGNPPAVTGYDAHTSMVLRSISCGYTVTYEALTNDYSNVNFSSGRLSWREMARSTRKLQNHMMIPQLCKGTWRWFVEGAILAGRVSEPAPAIWTPPALEMVDPNKETEATKSQIQAGLKSLSEAVREQGKDPEAHFSEIAEDQKMLEKYGLKFDTSPLPVEDNETPKGTDDKAKQ